MTFGVYPTEPVSQNPTTNRLDSLVIRAADTVVNNNFIFDYSKIKFTDDFQIVFDPGAVKSKFSYKEGERLSQAISLNAPLMFKTIFNFSNKVIPNYLAIEVGVPVGIISAVIAISLISIFIARRMQINSGNLSSKLSKKNRKV